MKPTPLIDIAELIAHQGGMCLLDRILEWDETRILLQTDSHRRPTNPLRVAGRLRALHLCEYGAQAMAVHGALRTRPPPRAPAADTAAGAASANLPGSRDTARVQAAPATGMLVSLRHVSFACDYIEDLPGSLHVAALCLQATPASLQYRFSIEHAGELLAEGRAAVMLAG